MTNEEAYKEIEKNAAAEMARCEDAGHIVNEYQFEGMLKSVVAYKMMQQHPGYFLNCYVDSPEYDTNKCNGYSFYMTVMNKAYIDCKQYGLTGKDMYDLQTEYGNEEGEKIYMDRAAAIINTAKKSDNIIMFCVEYFKFNY